RLRHASGRAAGSGDLSSTRCRHNLKVHPVRAERKRTIHPGNHLMFVRSGLDRSMLFVPLALLAATMAACAKTKDAPADDAIIVFNAGSLARPLRAALDSFTAGTKIRVEQENAGSVETARKLTELHRIPDLVGSADYQIFPKYLMPGQTSWYARFARNRMV